MFQSRSLEYSSRAPNRESCGDSCPDYPYHFEPAPVWKRADAVVHPEGCGDSCPDYPYHFQPAPVWKRVKADPAPPSLESTPGPYHFKPAPVWKRSDTETDASEPASLESTPGPYQFEAAPVWVQSTHGGNDEDESSSSAPLETSTPSNRRDPSSSSSGSAGPTYWCIPHTATYIFIEVTGARTSQAVQELLHQAWGTVDDILHHLGDDAVSTPGGFDWAAEGLKLHTENVDNARTTWSALGGALIAVYDFMNSKATWGTATFTIFNGNALVGQGSIAPV